ncbi:hypothetical protein [Caulobacter sp.]|uniref:hypothetical protein n=1 Tax=Caulobacter sp. TaxID=78 RepID=UPI0025C030D4|nr:hypothetical protein [Caulobacter sp.]
MTDAEAANCDHAAGGDTGNAQTLIEEEAGVSCNRSVLSTLSAALNVAVLERRQPKVMARSRKNGKDEYGPNPLS